MFVNISTHTCLYVLLYVCMYACMDICRLWIIIIIIFTTIIIIVAIGIAMVGTWVHSSMVRAAVSRSAGSWFKSGCAPSQHGILDIGMMASMITNMFICPSVCVHVCMYGHVSALCHRNYHYWNSGYLRQHDHRHTHYLGWCVGFIDITIAIIIIIITIIITVAIGIVVVGTWVHNSIV